MRRLLIRPQAWWFNKLPLSVLLFTTLLAHGAVTPGGYLSLAILVLAVSCVANFGYGINELFDQDEDARGGRANAAAERGAPLVWVASLLSAGAAVGLGYAGAGAAGAYLTAAVLVLPLTYSLPPIRTKERGWLGVLSDATAAHAFPAALALRIAHHQGLREVGPELLASVLVWAFATGLRGFLAHLLATRDHDRTAGLSTLAHSLDPRRLARSILFVLLPAELLAFGSVLASSGCGWAVAAFVSLYVVHEVRRARSPRVREAFATSYEGRVFAPATSRYVPFVDEAFYRAWGPLLLPTCLAIENRDLAFAGISVLALGLWWPRFRGLFPRPA